MATPVAGDFSTIHLSPNKEAVYRTTPVIDANILRHFQTAEPPAAEHEVVSRSNAGAAGRDAESVDEADAINLSLPVSYETTAGFWLAGFLAAFGMGNISSAGVADPWTHTIKRLSRWADLNIPSTSILHQLCADPQTLPRKLTGIVISDFFVEMGVNDVAAKMGMTLQGSGEYLTNAFTSQPLENDDPYLIRNDLDVQFGAEGAPTSVQDRIRTVRFEYDGAYLTEMARRFGDGLFRSRALAGPERASSIVLGFERDDTDSILDQWRGKTALECFLNWDDGANRQAKYHFHRCKIKGHSRTTESGVALENITLGPLDNDSDPLIEVTVKNDQSTYLI